MQNKKFDFKENPITAAIILFIIALVVTAALAGTNELTKDTIVLQAKAEQDQARLAVFPSAVSFEDLTAQTDLSKAPKISAIHKAFDKDKNFVGLVIVSNAKGYSGDIVTIIGISLDKTVTGVKVLSDNETPGLGKKVSLPAFIDQFAKRTASILFSLKKEDSNTNKIDAITGATISSNAMITAVNNALNLAFEEFLKLQTGGGK